jgi:hypothetical protein
MSLDDVREMLTRWRGLALADDGTIRERSGWHPDDIYLEVALDNEHSDLGRSYWERLTPGVHWVSVPWREAGAYAERLGLLPESWRQLKARYDALAATLQEPPVLSLAVNRIIHDVHGHIGGWSYSMHTRGLHDVLCTPEARALVSDRWRRLTIAKCHATHQQIWERAFPDRLPGLWDREGKHVAMLSWEEPGDLSPDPVVIAYRDEPFCLLIQTAGQFASRAGGSFGALAPAHPLGGPAVELDGMVIRDDYLWETPADPLLSELN